MAQWIKTSVRFNKIMENGAIKRVTEPYLVDALSFTEAEARIIEEVTPFISGEFTVSAVKKSNVTEIFWSDNDSDDKWYKAKMNYITINEKTLVEKKSALYILIQAKNFKKAFDNLERGMNGTMIDYEIVSIVETAILDVYKYTTFTEKTEKEKSE